MLRRSARQGRRGRRWIDQPQGPITIPADHTASLFNRADRSALKDKQNKLAQLDVTHPEAPGRAMVINDEPQPYNPHVFVQDNPGRRSEAVPRRFLKVLSSPDHTPVQPRRRPARPDRGHRERSQPASRSCHGQLSSSAGVTAYRRLAESASQVENFQNFPHWTGRVRQFGDKLPDLVDSFMHWQGNSGHVGPGLSPAVILRWTAARDTLIALEGTLGHTRDKGDGVRGPIVAGLGGVLGSWIAYNAQKPTPVERYEAKAGETIDFVVDCRAERTRARSVHLVPGRTRRKPRLDQSLGH